MTEPGAGRRVDDGNAAAAPAVRYQELAEIGHTLAGLLVAREREAETEEEQTALRAERVAVERRLREVSPDDRAEVETLVEEWRRRVEAELGG